MTDPLKHLTSTRIDPIASMINGIVYEDDHFSDDSIIANIIVMIRELTPSAPSQDTITTRHAAELLKSMWEHMDRRRNDEVVQALLLPYEPLPEHLAADNNA